ncbi:hypothetical protein AAFF_G00110400 [Aldrovandia affinis]|uniref:Uncharacterized protein n=1 Tax=Aldrovandia affinis TaxID=143900 RepID=A0AAD7RTM3_9TELE|nr:hypothetical protein AAFF_G00110400 [Aldrovandia affinis]
MHDHIHLNKQGIKVFAKVLKNTALGCSTVIPSMEPRDPTTRPTPCRRFQPPRPQCPPTPRAPNQHSSSNVRAMDARKPVHPTQPEQAAQPESYAAVASRAQNPTASEQNQIRGLLNINCSKLLQ